MGGGGGSRFSPMIGKLLLMAVTGRIRMWIRVERVDAKTLQRSQESEIRAQIRDPEIPNALLLLSCGWYTFPVKI